MLPLGIVYDAFIKRGPDLEQLTGDRIIHTKLESLVRVSKFFERLFFRNSFSKIKIVFTLSIIEKCFLCVPLFFKRTKPVYE
jgi:hypothetical protein